ncbi:uncharacterized protein LOC114286269 [Camellia sinensis]|uniref:uncharacterized protein LOC114286269 n=1 Tax=Camellia sinensis TaxID=4442 RepID=UPI001035BC6B|nr:uncharacterized protein LOC114286269 [Camellia sinensis]
MTTPESGKKDPAWKYATMVNPENLSKFKCNFCGKEMNGGVFRVKQHLVGGYRNVIKCPRCPTEVSNEVADYMAKKKQLKDQLNLMPDFDEMVNEEDFEDEDDVVEISPHGKQPVPIQGSTRKTTSTSIQLKPKKPRKIGPMDCFFTPEPELVVQKTKGKGKQIKIDENDPYRKELMERAYVRIARWIYDTGIPFNVVNNESFAPMIEAIGQFGPGLKPPSYHMIRILYLKKEVNHVHKLMKEHKEDWAKYGCSIMCDGWTDRKHRTLINFLVNCPRGTMFLESIDASSYSKDANKIFSLLDKFVDKIGEANVVQIVTDSAATNVLAGKFLEAKRPHLYWTPCAAHCMDLMLEDIFKLPNFKKTFERAIGAHGYIYNRPSLLNMMRSFTQLKELVKPAKSRFAPAFLTLQRLYQQRNNLRKMFTSEEWTKSKWAKEPQGKKTAQIMLMPSFWNHVHLALQFSCPLIHVLRMVDGEEKPPMGYIYEAMDRAKELLQMHSMERKRSIKRSLKSLIKGGTFNCIALCMLLGFI